MNQHQMILYKKEDTNVCIGMVDEDERSEEATTEFFSSVQREGSGEVKCYHPDAIIGVGCRVNSKKPQKESILKASVQGKNIKKTILRGIKGCTLNIYPEKTACIFFSELVFEENAVQIKENTTCH